MMARNPSPMAMVPEAQLIPLVLLGPVTPNAMATLQLAAPANTISASPGSTARMPPSTYRPCSSSAIPIPPSAVAHHDADAVAIFLAQIEFRVGQRHADRGDAELAEPVDPPRLPLLDMVGGVEVVHLRGDPGPERSRIEPGDFTHRRHTPPQPRPEALDADSDRRDGADPGDDDSPRVSHRSASTARARPASVRDAMPCTKIGPMTHSAAGTRISGHAGPSQVCTMVTSVCSAPCGTTRQTTSMPAVIPRTWRYRTSRRAASIHISDSHQTGQATGPKGRTAAISTTPPSARRWLKRTQR